MLVYALVALDIDWTVGRVLAIPLAIVAGAVIYGARLGRARDDRVLGRRRDRGRERLHLRRQLPLAVPDRHLRALAARPRRLRRSRSRSSPTFRRSTCSTRRTTLGLPDGAAVPVAARRGRRGRSPRRRDLAERRPPLPERGADPSSRSTEVAEALHRPREDGRLRRERRVVKAVDGITFEIERGRDASATSARTAPGKSTTVKMLTGILVPSAGRISRRGPRPVAAADRARAPDRRGLRPALAALVGPAARATRSSCCATSTACPAARHRANLDRFARGARARPVPRHARAPALARPADARRADGGAPARPGDRLPRRADDRPRRRRARRAVREFLAEVNRERGVTVLLTTHDLADIERLCSRLLIIDHGRLIWDGGLDELKRRYGHGADARRRPRGAGAAARGRRARVSCGSRGRASGSRSGATRRARPSSRPRSRRAHGSSTSRSRRPTSRRSSGGSTQARSELLPRPDDDVRAGRRRSRSSAVDR